jgi:ubiquinone/menaquinone biosynthesis C-methylase UbiE
LSVVQGDAKMLPFTYERFDALLCIAMFHHLLTDTDRHRSFREIIRVLKSGGHGILTCWSTIQPEESKFIFTEGLNVVPWNGKQTRYYYVYSESMFREYFQSFSEITIESIYNECGNWILVFRKK